MEDMLHQSCGTRAERWCVVLVFFFFQAEDGIRDLTVTGVQTCALPICVITTATYPARQFGVGSAMGMMKAARLCPQAILLPVDFAEVRRFSRMFKEIIVSIAPLMEDRGVDEVYIDFTDVPGGQREGGRVLARLIQKTITDATGLTCSIGVAPRSEERRVG